jgi:hypothetical protein
MATVASSLMMRKTEPVCANWSASLRETELPVMIAVVSAWSMQVPGNEIVNVVVMWNCFVPTVRAMSVRAVVTAASMIGSTRALVFRALSQCMLIYVIGMDMVQMSVMQVISMLLMLHRFVTTSGSMFVLMSTMCFATGHLIPFILS